ncbi:hypothetical protein BDR22DRAFT_841427 [Usnea florida]
MTLSIICLCAVGNALGSFPGCQPLHRLTIYCVSASSRSPSMGAYLSHRSADVILFPRDSLPHDEKPRSEWDKKREKASLVAVRKDDDLVIDATEVRVKPGMEG